MNKKYRVTLPLAEREELERLLARGKADVRKIKHAQILLKADEAESGPAWPDVRIAEAFAAGITTVERVRQRFVEEGFASALSPYRGGTRVYEKKLDGAQEARLIGSARRTRPLDLAPAGAAYGRTGLRRHALLRDRAPDAQKRTPSNRTGERCGVCPRSPRPSSSTTWKTCWRSTTARMIPSGPWCAWMRPSSS